MEINATSVKCPNCGAPVATTDTTCKWCSSPVVISTFSSVEKMSLPLVNKYVGAYKQRISADASDANAQMSIGLCFLKLKLYDQALAALQKAMENCFDNADIYFYACVCVMAGKKAYVLNRTKIDLILSYIDAANSIESRPIFKYFEAYVRYDYFYRNSLNTLPRFDQCLGEARQLGGVSEADKTQLFALLGVPRPAGMGF